MIRVITPVTFPRMEMFFNESRSEDSFENNGADLEDDFGEIFDLAVSKLQGQKDGEE